MAKILIAGLGKGMIDRSSPENERDYRKANYKIDGKVYEGEYFVTSVIEQHYNIDKTIYIGTAGSMWDKLYAHYCKKNEMEIEGEHLQYIEELKKITQKSNKTTDISLINSKKFNDVFKNKNKQVEILITKYGMNKEEIFENFNLIIEIINSLKEEDEIYLDITHSFRSNAMWIFLVMNYITDVVNKNINIAMITYGMLEETDKETINEKEKDIAQIIKLKSFYELMKWIKGAHSFKGYGNSYEFLEMIDNLELKNELESFSNSMNLNDITNIRKNIEEIKKLKEVIGKLEGPSKLLLPNILNEFLDTFGENDKKEVTLLNLAEWHYKQKRYSMAYVNIVESMYEFLERKTRCKDRGTIKIWINKVGNDDYDDIKLSKSEIKNIKLLNDIFNDYREIRNKISHTLEKSNKETTKKLISNIENDIQKLREIYKIVTEKLNDEIIEENTKSTESIESIKNITAKKSLKEILKEKIDEIYNFLFEELEMPKNSESKSEVLILLSKNSKQFLYKKEKQKLNDILLFYQQGKNGTIPINEKQIIKKSIEVEEIIKNKKFTEALKNLKINKNTNLNEKQEITVIVIGYNKLSDNQIKELKDNFKITKIMYLTEEYKEKWNNVGIKEGNLEKIKKNITKTIFPKDYVLVNGEIGSTFNLVGWCKLYGYIPIYSLEFKEIEKMNINGKIQNKIIKKHLEYKKY